MDEAVAVAHVVDEGTEIHGLHHLAVVDDADLGIGGNAADPLDGGFRRALVDGRHLDRAVVVDVDLGAGHLADLADHLAAGADHLADLVLVDGDHGDARGILADRLAGGRERRRHLAQDVQAAVARLRQCRLHDLLGDRGDLDVHLQGRDSFLGTGHLEVHVAQVVLVADDVGKNGETVVLLDQAHGDAGHRALQGNAGVHHRERRTAHRGHGRRAVRFGDLGDHADGVGKRLLFRHQRMDGPPGKLAVADLAPPRRPQHARFADAVGREVVVQHEVFAVIAAQRVDDLLVLAGAERGDHQRLRLATGEKRAAVRPRQDADLADDGAHGTGVAAVDAPAGGQDVASDDLLLQALENAGQKLGIDGFVRRQLGADAILDRRHLLLAGQLDRLGISLAQVGFGHPGNPRRQLVESGRRPGNRQRLLGTGLGQIDDGIDHRAHLSVAEHDGAQHHLFGKLGGLGFDHQHAFARTRQHQIERRVGHLVDARIEHVFTVDVADAAAGDGSQEGDSRNGQRRRRSDHGDDVGLVLQVVGEGRANDLGLVPVALGEQRPDGPVDEPRGERGLVAGAGFALEEAAGYLAGSEHLFLEVDGQRKEIDVATGRLLGHRRAQHLGLAIGHQDGTVGLARDLAGLQDQAAPAPLDFLFKFLEHTFSSFLRTCGQAAIGRRPGNRGPVTKSPYRVHFSKYGWQHCHHIGGVPADAGVHPVHARYLRNPRR